ncbi:protein-L-isoaspartate(D-aspartate) O-methyltransferase [Thermosporothrix hazakensis]|jgi:protein-L-isoaspartate(D-aspartate) O-methyltransferase|uniref:Protein-L-isoaspartate O-methyltransferase n=1 Tax=Thermosporothrix hazakensis TaxID=644383 RepID=A0A326U603_THEHA|nr:methyltransferase domain-containing protein [Thermosporothrix hazakensis]PZW19347.1 protein-L-isoaspartate(D-aspartate) O-methyltransferase [Thermosporothrix hazakensis]GCE49902.1 hypothetical protein KTH_47710 [Thermosporothrix hazakensis]
MTDTEHLVRHIEQRLQRPLQPAIRQAFLHIPREEFVSQYYQKRENGLSWKLVPASTQQVYQDQVLVTAIDDKERPFSSSSQPSVMALQLEALEIQPGQRILEIGTGTGYNAALLGFLVGAGGQVISIDIQEGLLEAAKRRLSPTGNISVLYDDGFAGCREYAPYDRILATCGVRQVPQAWTDQLQSSGRLICNLHTNLTSIFLCADKCPSGRLEGRLLDIDAAYMLMHTGSYQPGKPLDWSAYEALPQRHVQFAEPVDVLLKSPAFCLQLQALVPGIFKKYHGNREAIYLYLLTDEVAMRVDGDSLLFFGDQQADIEQKIKQCVQLYRASGRLPISEYRFSLDGDCLHFSVAGKAFQLCLQNE